ncbi:DUF3093 family protein [Motilibacter rhizosphaerae]|uniref:DUF3093 family protein n=1 Tax=Motilibacter rhizosphaerae TaxID=598652 RepID=A0A4Q7NG98_9ACTN|nr:DUF3093 domain-containing protein [Motilibacter rhizosphaerae]RZS82967.1 DUF3093 family protein [Motilibacter rhizosphaerae]
MPPTSAYQERLSAPPTVWLACAVVLLGILPVTVAVMPLAAAGAVTVVVLVLAALALRRWEPEVVVAGGELRAGRARIPLALIGPAEPLDAARAALLRGPGIEPRAFHLLRPWTTTAVLVPVLDPEDPTPYWYVSTRRPERLAEVLDGVRAAHEG